MTDLIERIKWITDAVSGQDLGVNALTSYLLRDGFIHASDGRMVVGTPFPFEGEALVPAEEFERVLINKPDGDFTWEFEPEKLVLKRGRFRSRIKLLPTENWIYPTDVAPDLHAIPDGFVESMEALLPFCSENATKPWATTIAIIGDYLYASNNIVVARSYFVSEARCPRCSGAGCSPHSQAVNGSCGMESPPVEHLVPRWVAEFVVKRAAGLSGWFIDERQITFTWVDGSWMRSSLIVDRFPDVLTVFKTFYEERDIGVPITSEWKKVVRRIGKITGDPVIRLRADGIYGASKEEVLSVEDDGGTPCPEGLSETVWDLRFLEAVLDIATHWDPTVYPKPAPWRGEFLEGIIAGRRD